MRAKTNATDMVRYNISYSSPSRLVPRSVLAVTPNRLIPLNLSFKHSWIQSCINLKTPVDVVDVEGANTIEFEYAFANDSINSSGLIKHISVTVGTLQ
jgi:hypothetical protein